MSTSRTSSALATVQVGTLRFDRGLSTIPPTGSVLAVDATGSIAPSTSLSVATLESTGALSAGTLTTVGGATINGRLAVGSSMGVTGHITATDAMIAPVIASTSDFTGVRGIFTQGITTGALNATVGIYTSDIKANWLDVSGLKTGQNIDVSGNLRVEKLTYLVGGVTAHSSLDVGGNALFRSGVTLKQGLDVSGASVFRGPIQIYGPIDDVDVIHTTRVKVDGVFTDRALIGSQDYAHTFPTLVVMDISGGALFRSGITLKQGIDVSGGSLFRSGVTLKQGLDVSGGSLFRSGVTLKQGLDVSGSALFRSGVTLRSGVDVSGGSLFRSGVTLKQGLDVSGGSLFRSGITLKRGLDVSGSLIARNGVITTTLKADWLDVSGMRLGQNLDVSGNFRVEQGSTFVGGVTMMKSLTLGATLDVSGTAVFRSSTSVMGSTFFIKGTTAQLIVNPNKGSGNNPYMTLESTNVSSSSSKLPLSIQPFGGGITLGSSGSTIDVQGQIIGNGTSPIGSLTMFAGAAAPVGWFLCNGQAVNRTTYAGLFAVIGTLYGSGDGVTTFNVPNLQNKFPVGAGATYTIGTSGGSTAYTPAGTVGGTSLTAAQLPPHTHGVSLTTSSAGDHTHGVNDPGHTHTMDLKYMSVNFSNTGGYTPIDFGGVHTSAVSTTGITLQNAGAHTHTVTGNTDNGPGSSQTHTHSFTGTAATITPPYIAINYIIKY